MRKRILIIDPVRSNITAYIHTLRLGGLKVFEVITASTVEQAKLFLTLQPISLIIVNAKYIRDGQDELYQQALRYHPSVKFILLHSTSEKDHATLPRNSYYSNAQGLIMLLTKASTCLT